MLSEDSTTGKLSDERFVKLSREYELEQDNLKSMADILRKDLKQQEQKKTNAKSFIATVKKYTDLTELDATVLREFVDKIYVSKTSGKKRCKAAEAAKTEKSKSSITLSVYLIFRKQWSNLKINQIKRKSV